MSTVDEIEKLCEQYVGRRFGKRDKAALLDFLRSLQGQRPGDSDDDEPVQQKYVPAPRQHTQHATQQEEPQGPALTGAVKEGTLLHKKASQYATLVNKPTVSEGASRPVKVSDIADVEGVQERKNKWVNDVASPDKINYNKADPSDTGYKVADATTDVKNRRSQWESGNVGQSEYKKSAAEELGYKVSDAEDIKKRRAEWEAGKTAPGGDIKKNVVEERGYKVSDAEDVKKRREEWETGKVAQTGAHFKKTAAEEAGYKVSDSEDVRKRREEWESGKVAESAPKKTDTEQAGYKVDDASASIKDRLNQWTEAEHDQKSANTQERKAPIELPQSNLTVDDQIDVVSVSIVADDDDQDEE